MSLKLKNIKQLKESMTIEQKKKLLVGLRSIKEKYNGNVGGETDIDNQDNLVSEDEFTSTTPPDQKVIAKTFNTKGDFDTYILQRRGIEITPKERQAIIGLKQIKPTQQDKFFIKYETSDEFGNNDTTVIKKLKEGNQFCWTAFSKHENAKDEGTPDEEDNKPSDKFDHSNKADNKDNIKADDKNKIPDLGSLKEIENQLLSQNNEEEEEMTVNDTINITKTITFLNDTEGANILSKFLTNLDL